MIEDLYAKFLKLTNDPGAAATLVLADTIAAKARLLTVPQAAEMLGISRSKLYEMCESGDIKCLRIGRLVRIEPEALTDIREPKSKRIADLEQCFK